MSNTKKQNRQAQPRKSSGGGRGKFPVVKAFKVMTGGTPSSRNRKWLVRKAISKTASMRNPVSEIEVKIYLDTNNISTAENFYSALKEVLGTLDFEISRENPAEKGSWIKNLWVKIKGVATSKEVVSRLEKLERGLELAHIDKVQSEVDLNTAEAIARLIESTKDVPNFSCLVGSLLFAKATIDGEAKVFAQVLTQDQLSIIKSNSSIIYKPHELIQKMYEVQEAVIAENKPKQLEGN